MGYELSLLFLFLSEAHIPIENDGIGVGSIMCVVGCVLCVGQHTE